MGVVDISGGNDYSMALLEDGTVMGWGYNGSGQLGDGTITHRSTPVQALNLMGVVDISSGQQHSMALLEDGTVMASGRNYYGQLGNGTTTQRTQPVQVLNLMGVVAISAGYEHSMALLEDGTIMAWGRNNKGQTNVPEYFTTNNSDPSKKAIQVAGGQYHSLALKADGTVVGWGANSQGQIDVPEGLSGVVAISASKTDEPYSAAIKSDGTIVVWGARNSETECDAVSISGEVALRANGRLVNLECEEFIIPYASGCQDTDNSEINCLDYEWGNYACGAANDDDFDSNEMCCVCGGGSYGTLDPDYDHQVLVPEPTSYDQIEEYAEQLMEKPKENK